MNETHNERCQFVMSYKRVELPSMKPIDPPIPVLCGRREGDLRTNPWECGGPLSHQFQRFSQVGRWMI